jgi:hypothetical protein
MPVAVPGQSANRRARTWHFYFPSWAAETGLDTWEMVLRLASRVRSCRDAAGAEDFKSIRVFTFEVFEKLCDG